MPEFIYQYKNWPVFIWETEPVINLLSEARNRQGRLIGKMDSYDFDLKSEALLETLTLDVIKSTEIEGEFFDADQVRSSVARKLGMEIARSVDSDRNIDGMAEMMIDATSKCFEPLTSERLFNWHASLFPSGQGGTQKITVGAWRKDKKGPMRVLSGAVGKEKIHFQAPDASMVNAEMKRFLDWFNHHDKTDLVIKAALAHLWFVTIHPFEDGNGRIARALTDMLLVQADNTVQRFYSMSAQIRIERKKYYAMLEKTQRGNLDITDWIIWFLQCLINTLKATDVILQKVIMKAHFWNHHAKTIFNERQKKLLNKLLDGFEGNLTSSKWAKIAKCSKDTAIRDINDLISKNVLQKDESGGRSTNYVLKM